MRKISRVTIFVCLVLFMNLRGGGGGGAMGIFL